MAIEKEVNKDRDPFYFSPESRLWKLNRERILIMGGPRAILMQIAHPLVCEAVYNHSSFRDNPIERLNRTLALTSKIVFGTKEDTLKAAEVIKKTHHRVKGTLTATVGPYPKDTNYNAQDPQLSTWVYATLVDSAIVTYDKLVNPLSAMERQRYYKESKEFARLFGIREENLPISFEGLQVYIRRMIKENRVTVSPKAKELSEEILKPQRFALSEFLNPPFSLVTAGLLPPKLRKEYGLSWSPFKEACFETLCQSIQKTIPVLPKRLRYVPEYRQSFDRFINWFKNQSPIAG